MWRVSAVAVVMVAGCGRGFFDPDLARDCDAMVATGPPPRFVQANFSSTGAVQAQGRLLPFTLSQTAGNTIVAVVMWESSAGNIVSLYDDAGNSYAAAVGPTENANGWGQATFVATNITAAAPGFNSVHVSLSALARLRLAVLEYADVDTAQPLDGTAATFGGPATSVSPGGITTTHASDVLVGATSSSNTLDADYPTFTRRTSGPDFVIQDRVADVAEGDTPVAAGPNNDWIAQLIALRGR
jgi:hypothetical protein